MWSSAVQCGSEGLNGRSKSRHYKAPLSQRHEVHEHAAPCSIIGTSWVITGADSSALASATVSAVTVTRSSANSPLTDRQLVHGHPWRCATHLPGMHSATFIGL